MDAVFFDANGDHYPDLYVVSGGNEYTGNAPELNDRLYINDGKGHFTKSVGLPEMHGNKSVVRVADFDHDGDMDIFVGGRADAEVYGIIPTSYLLQNDGNGNFTIVNDKLLPELNNIGMVTDASWIDVNKDGWPDLLIVGEWMQPVLFKNDHGKFIREELTEDDGNLKGWWCSVKAVDINGDGYEDLLLGNYGLNSKLIASHDYPLKMYLADISGNKRMDQILALAKNGKYYPFLGKEDLEWKLPYLKKEFLSYRAIAGKTVEEIFGSRLNDAKLFTATILASVLLINDGKGHFKKAALPSPLQWAPIFAFAPGDYNSDGKMDFIAGGNFYGTTPYEGRYDALSLSLYIGDGKGVFQPVFPLLPAFENIKGEVRSIQPIILAGNKNAVIIGINNDSLQILQW